ncbi:MAG: DUF4139 domain-containing protein [Burkholderiales bacterium]|nr:DUF4139 domain-containing protein [Burkholderiales bacterium]MDR4518903.1 DUF4139 domain-containing protein [Nitrosomonas sp.]
MKRILSRYKPNLISLSCFILLTGLFALLTITRIPAASASSETIVTRENQTGIALSLYQQDLALIQDTRQITLNDGANTLSWQEISTQTKPETAWLSHVAGSEQISIIARHFDLEPLTPQNLLESFVGKLIIVIRTNPVTGEELRESATVLTTNGGVVLQFKDRVETGIPGRLAFPEIPGNLHDKPAMIILLNNSATEKQEKHTFQLTYLTHGLSWQADYILKLGSNETHADLLGLATLTNQSGIDYHNAQIQLIAGDINQARTVRAPAAKRLNREMELMSATYADLDTEPLSELHRYTLPGKTNLMDKQSKQIVFMSANGIPVEKTLVLTGQNYYYSSYYHPSEQKQSVEVFINFRNSGKGLGVPLPKGVIRAYTQEKQNDLHFVGEDTITHTANKDIVQLKLGHAFDVTAEKKQTDFKKIPSPDQNIRQFESAHQITLSNAKNKTVTVIVREPIPGDWHMLSESQRHREITSNLVEWTIELPAESNVELTYRVRTML